MNVILKNGNIFELMNEIEDKKLVCFGGGQALTNFINLFSEFKLETRIKYIVDNNSKKSGTFFNINESHIAIISYDEFIARDMKNVVMLITSLYYVDMYEQLKNSRKNEELMCYIYRYVIDESHPYFWEKGGLPNELKRLDKQLIPKKIHYCWFGKNTIPEQNKKYMETWKKYCPDYEIIEWNEDNYDFSQNKYAYEAYRNKKWAFVSDVARLDIIYHYGGIYLDTDVEILKNLDELLYQEGFMGTYYTGEVNTGLGFGAQKGNQLIKEMLNQYERYEFSIEKGMKTLPLCVDYQTDYLKSKGYDVKGGYQIIDGVAIYPEEILENVCFDTKRRICSKNTFMLHHSDASWRDDDDKDAKAVRLKFWKEHFETEK